MYSRIPAKVMATIVMDTVYIISSRPPRLNSSLTISLFDIEPDEDAFTLNIIPETQYKTNIAGKTAGDIVNIEADMMIKHINHLLNFEKAGGRHV